MQSWLEYSFRVDETLIDDGTYLVAEIAAQLIGAGGWSRRKTFFQGEGGTPAQTGAVFAQPPHEPALIRMFFVDPDWARCGVGSRLLQRCEAEAAAAGYQRLELMATLTGEPLYAARGYNVMERVRSRLRDGVEVDCVRMTKEIPQTRLGSEEPHSPR
jgi:GNAT superfamily N-acetyltransferase